MRGVLARKVTRSPAGMLLAVLVKVASIAGEGSTVISQVAVAVAPLALVAVTVTVCVPAVAKVTVGLDTDRAEMPAPSADAAGDSGGCAAVLFQALAV